ncbi:ribose-phosphate diphosphokinase [Mobiluncus mulieris]|uniref:ribose-phosphate diphosphokinase n=2 Tax=Mobiluncus mulieris TaxID=2052 RepID=E0QMC5_9ACTO|nr:ribose-phosphate diphosphokinase [Mobiluncus mulieris]EEJ53297.1 ribose-phosphate diphosphokinase [Mobiluncus mulieris ATCC 35243]EEZ92224.1 ribose-phosphate diphosphokinase [Mobiluncus mulieris 28-1]EFM47299.1 ribose-phosphate diphosphokinase [Mobiluncus mulieris ATCC 35239]EFN92562.1 ribose-phosphate diphosphokinase [Mobiluncus mulieris FB024-16]MBB5845216.1 ribose-phosphate pyrophosphokinase [Mobiluncus mulieris]
MADLFETPRKRLVIVSGRSHHQLAEDVAKALDTEVLPTTIYDFASGEIYVRYNESVRGCDVFCIQSISGDVNKWFMEQLIMVDALKRASAKRITVVAPLYPYSRQDKKHQGREPISARLMADLYKTAGASRLMSVDMHASQEQGFFVGPVDHLMAMPVLIDYVRTRVELNKVTVVSPDAGRIRVAEKWANRLGGNPLAFIHKTRDTTRPNVAVANRVVGEVEGRTCVLVDDLIDTGGTIAEAVGVLKAAGAKDVLVAATHGVLSDPATKRLSECGAREIIVTDTVPIPAAKRFPQLVVLPIAPLLARAIRQVFEEGSVAALFE